MANENEQDPTPEQMAEEAAGLEKIIDEALLKALPPDMTMEKVHSRTSMFGMAFGLSRTSVVAALIYGSFYARIVGLDVPKMHELLDSVDAAVKDSPTIQQAKENYAKMNAEYHAKQFDKQIAEDFGDIVWASTTGVDKKPN